MLKNENSMRCLTLSLQCEPILCAGRTEHDDGSMQVVPAVAAVYMGYRSHVGSTGLTALDFLIELAPGARRLLHALLPGSIRS